MKRLLVVRHAKSSWDSPLMDDFDRPLNERGKRDAPKMAQRVLDKQFEIEACITSPAKRARTTAKHFAALHEATGNTLIEVPALYHATVAVFYDTIAAAEDRYHTIAVFSHNPGITDFVNTLTEVKIDDMPTCAAYAISIAAESWKDFEKAEKTFLFFDYPKLGD